MRKIMVTLAAFGLIIFLYNCFFEGNNILIALADNNQSCVYSYDKLGRIRSVQYPNGAEYEYVYDSNGNIISIISKNDSTALEDKEGDDDKKTESSESTKDKTTEQKAEGTKAIEDITKSDKTTDGTAVNTSDNNTVIIETNIPDIIMDEANGSITIKDERSMYNQFKKKYPVIKSLKLIKNGKKRYLRIQLRRMGKKNELFELGYQIKYSYNAKFKKSKSYTINRNTKKKITTKKWKVADKKNYYVKVRAFVKMRSGKIIYSRYCKTRRIKS